MFEFLKGFNGLVQRIKQGLVSTAMTELHADFIEADAARQAKLFQLAEEYQAKGLTVVADNLRRRAAAMDQAAPGLDRQLNLISEMPLPPQVLTVAEPTPQLTLGPPQVMESAAQKTKKKR